MLFLAARPEGTKQRLRGLNAWVATHARQIIAGVALFVGAYLTVSGFVGLV
jgi:hypothetical protein